MYRFLFFVFVSLYSGSLMAATGHVQMVSGEVKTAIGANAPVAVTQNSILENGMTVSTGANGRIIMKFEDGQVVALNENTSFRINQYHFDQAKPEQSRMVFSLLKGAMRAVSGLIAKHNASAFRLQTPMATIGIRGTDFMAATGSLYLQVINGMVSATTTAGTTAFAVGQTGFVGSLTALPSVIAATQLPVTVATSFSQLGSMAVTGAGAATGGASSGGTTGSVSGTGGTAGTTGAATGGTTATAGTAVGGAAGATGAAVGGLTTVAVAGTVAAVAAVAAVTANQNTTAATTTVTAP